MLDIRTILVPVDLTRQAVPAVEEALRLASRFDATVVLLHVFPPLRLRVGVLCEEVVLAGEEWLTAEQRQVVEKCAGMSPRIRIRYCIGRTAESIVCHAGFERADLIVMQTGERPLWSRLFRRPDTAAVLESSPCPVWAGTAASLSKPDTVRHVLCALALAPGNSRVLAWASSFAQREDAALSIVHVDPTFRPMLLRGEDCGWRRTTREWARQRIQHLRAETNVNGSVWLESGDPVETVGEIARATRADLVVIGRSQPGLLHRPAAKTWMFAHAMPCPVASC